MNIFQYDPHKHQQKIHADTARFRIINAGRRFGKTMFGAAETAQTTRDIERLKGRSAWVWCLAPTSNVLNSVVIPACLESWAPLIKEHNRSERRILLQWPGSRLCHKIEFRSGDEDDARLKGPKLDFAWLDEFQGMRKSVWFECVRPALSDSLGRAIFTGTPRGRNWGHNIFLWGQEGKNEYKAWSFESRANPYFPEQEWEAARREVPQDVFRQEYCAEFLANVCGIFRNIDQCVYNACLREPEQRRDYVAGVDIARINDYTVIIIMDKATRHVVYFDRFNQIDWTLQRQKVVDAVKRYNDALVVLDATSIGGDQFAEALEGEGARVDRFTFTNKSKKSMIDKLAIAIETSAIRYPPWKDLLEELDAYQYVKSEKSNTFQYGAPEGSHDDCVTALGLANWGCGGLRTASGQSFGSRTNYDGLSNWQLGQMLRSGRVPDTDLQEIVRGMRGIQ